MLNTQVAELDERPLALIAVKDQAASTTQSAQRLDDAYRL